MTRKTLLESIQTLSWFYILLALFPLTFAAADSGYVVLVNPSAKLEILPTQTLERVFLGEQIFWDGGTKVVAFHTDVEADPMKGFVLDVLHLDPDRFLAHWRRKVFSGRGLPPNVLDSDLQVAQEVSRSKGAIGIVSSNYKAGPEVKAVRVKE